MELLFKEESRIYNIAKGHNKSMINLKHAIDNNMNKTCNSIYNKNKENKHNNSEKDTHLFVANI